MNVTAAVMSGALRVNRISKVLLSSPDVNHIFLGGGGGGGVMIGSFLTGFLLLCQVLCLQLFQFSSGYFHHHLTWIIRVMIGPLLPHLGPFTCKAAVCMKLTSY